MIGDPLGEAVTWILSSGLLAYPTETVWGLGADARSENAIARLRAWKGRADRQPLSILVPDVEALDDPCFDPPDAARTLAASFWPGPLTLVVPAREDFAPGVARDDGAVGLRCSAHPLASALARRLRGANVGPITATSLNRAGESAARVRDDALALCGAGPYDPHPLDVEGAEAGGDEASTVVDLTGAKPEVLRWGALRRDELEPVLARVTAP